MTCEQSADDFFMTLNGFDEIAIAKSFGHDITDLRKAPLMFLRALVFVNERRQGAKDGPAHNTAMQMTVGEVNDYFPDKAEEPADEDDDPKEEIA